MTSKPDGGPAFPRTLVKDRPHGQFIPEDGMTLRDYFAAAALQGYIATGSHPGSFGPYPEYNTKAAEHAYQYADAMLAERSK